MRQEFPPSWVDQLTLLEFEQFTPIQEQAFPLISSGKNLLAISPTGTGKTLAYLWPSLLKLQPQKPQQLLILAPNSELAGQIFEVCKTWAEPLGLSSQLFLSGSSQKRQIERLKKGPEILIGTPGRILELIKLKKIKMMNVDTIVLDEFDELLGESQFGFVKTIISHVPRQHQMIYTSATDAVDRNKIAKDTCILDVAKEEATSLVKHTYILVDKRDRLELLRKMSNLPDFRALTFFNSLSDLGASEEKLLYLGAPVASLASDVNIKFRKILLERFKEKNLTLLLATDLVGRGIDIDNLECVVNFDLPRDQDTYTHRAGRTGRMGKDGLVITFISHPNDLKILKKYAAVSEIQLKNQHFYTVKPS